VHSICVILNYCTEIVLSVALMHNAIRLSGTCCTAILHNAQKGKPIVLYKSVTFRVRFFYNSSAMHVLRGSLELCVIMGINAFTCSSCTYPQCIRTALSDTSRYYYVCICSGYGLIISGVIVLFLMCSMHHDRVSDKATPALLPISASLRTTSGVRSDRSASCHCRVPGTFLHRRDSHASSKWRRSVRCWRNCAMVASWRSYKRKARSLHVCAAEWNSGHRECCGATTPLKA
jgi:hypothetical protein